MNARLPRPPAFDLDLTDLPPPARRRAWMARVEAVVFASPEPVPLARLAEVVGADCDLPSLIEDIRAELADRPYDLVEVAGGWRHQTRPELGAILVAAAAADVAAARASQGALALLCAVAIHQPITRGEIGEIFGREISGETLGALKRDGLLATGPRSPRPGSPPTYVTTPRFLSAFGLRRLSDLPGFLEAQQIGGGAIRDGEAQDDDSDIADLADDVA